MDCIDMDPPGHGPNMCPGTPLAGVPTEHHPEAFAAVCIVTA